MQLTAINSRVKNAALPNPDAEPASLSLLAPGLGLGCGDGAGRGKTARPRSGSANWIEIGFEGRESAGSRLGRRLGTGTFIAGLTAGSCCFYSAGRGKTAGPCSLRIGGIEVCFKFKLPLSHNASLARNQHRDLGIGEHFLGLAAEQHAGEPAAAVRSHEDEFALVLLWERRFIGDASAQAPPEH
jgi:hypothetical protein